MDIYGNVTSSFEVDELISVLGKGRDNAKKRSRLSIEMDMSDRQLRKIIERARNDGFVIINNQDGNGYYLSDDIDEIERNYRQERKRALCVLKRLKKMRQLLLAGGRKV